MAKPLSFLVATVTLPILIAPKTTAAFLALLLAIAVSLGACGSSAETGTGESTASSPAGAAREKSQTGEGGQNAEQRPATGSAQFRSEGGDNSIQEFGSEASASERAAAAAVLHRYLDARAERDWEAACAQLAPGISQGLAQQFEDNGKSDCAAILAKLTAAVPAAALRQAAVADVGSLRVEGEQAFLLFHGADEGAYFIPMAQEGGAWKVAAIAASPLL